MVQNQIYNERQATEIIGRASYAEQGRPFPTKERNYAMLPEGEYTLNDLKGISEALGRGIQISDEHLEAAAADIADGDSLVKRISDSMVYNSLSTLSTLPLPIRHHTMLYLGQNNPQENRNLYDDVMEAWSRQKISFSPFYSNSDNIKPERVVAHIEERKPEEKYAEIRNIAEKYHINGIIEPLVRLMVKSKERKGLERIFGNDMNNKEIIGKSCNTWDHHNLQKFAAVGNMIGTVLGFLSYHYYPDNAFLAPLQILGGGFIGSFAGIKVSQHLARRQLYSRAKEIDYFLKESGVFQTGEGIDLEDRVELTEDEKYEIWRRSMSKSDSYRSFGFLAGAVMGAVAELGNGMFASGIGAVIGSLVGSLTGSFVGEFAWKKYYEHQKLKEKRGEKDLAGRLTDWVDDHTFRRRWHEAEYIIEGDNYRDHMVAIERFARENRLKRKEKEIYTDPEFQRSHPLHNFPRAEVGKYVGRHIEIDYIYGDILQFDIKTKFKERTDSVKKSLDQKAEDFRTEIETISNVALASKRAICLLEVYKSLNKEK